MAAADRLMPGGLRTFCVAKRSGSDEEGGDEDLEYSGPAVGDGQHRLSEGGPEQTPPASPGAVDAANKHDPRPLLERVVNRLAVISGLADPNADDADLEGDYLGQDDGEGAEDEGAKSVSDQGAPLSGD